MVMLTPTLLPSNALPTQPNGRPMQRALSHASKSVCKTTFIAASCSAKLGQPTWMVEKRRHEKRQNASKKFRMQALPRAIKTTHSNLITTISNIKTPVPHITHLTTMASYHWMLMPRLHPTPQHYL